jgi:hypothetical protein
MMILAQNLLRDVSSVLQWAYTFGFQLEYEAVLCLIVVLYSSVGIKQSRR